MAQRQLLAPHSIQVQKHLPWHVLRKTLERRYRIERETVAVSPIPFFRKDIHPSVIRARRPTSESPNCTLKQGSSGRSRYKISSCFDGFDGFDTDAIRIFYFQSLFAICLGRFHSGDVNGSSEGRHCIPSKITGERADPQHMVFSLSSYD